MTYEGGTWPSGVQVQLTRVQTASPPVHGTFSITYGGRTTDGEWYRCVSRLVIIIISIP